MTGREDDLKRMMDEGNSAAWDQDWEKAAGYYRQVLVEFPDHIGALTSLGLALFELQRDEESLQCYLKAAKVTPENPIPIEKAAQIYARNDKKELAQTAALRAAELYLKNREVSKAIETWNWVVILNPENLQAHSRLAVVFERMGKNELAVQEYLAIAAVLQRSGSLTKAAQAVQHAGQIAPNTPKVLDAQAMLRDARPIPIPEPVFAAKRGGDTAESLGAVSGIDETTMGGDPIYESRQKALAVLAGVLFEESEGGRYEQEVKRGFQSILDGSGSIWSKSMDFSRVKLHLSQVIDLQTQENYAQAAEELERAIEAGLDHAAAYYDLGWLRLQQERYESATRSLLNAVQHPDFAMGARLLLGQTLQRLGRLGEASVEYMQALKLADLDSVPAQQMNDLSQIYDPLIENLRHEVDLQRQEQICDNISAMLLRNDWREQLSRARTQLPDQSNGGPLVPLAEMLVQSRSSKVVESLNKIYQLNRSGHYRSAMEEAYYALQFAPTYLPLHAYMGELLLRRERVQEAIDKFLTVAKSYNLRGESQYATDYYRKVVDLAPLDVAPRVHLIDQLIAQDRIEDAIVEYEDLAAKYYRIADLGKAREIYTEAIQLARKSGIKPSRQVQIMDRIADIDLQSLDWRQALSVYEQIRNLKPDEEKARRSLVELNFRLGQEDRALAELNSYLTYLGKAGREADAVEFLESMAEELPEHPAIRRRLAAYYHHQGRDAEAIAQLDKLGEMLIDAGDIMSAIQVVENILALHPPNAEDYQQLLYQLRDK